jgi:hypothetical protein
MEQPEVSYPCKHCYREFKYKSQYSEHISACEFLKTRAKDRNTNLELEDDDIPNERMLYELMKNLAFRCQNLEKEVKDLRQAARREKRKIDVIQYLNAHQVPQTTYKKWRTSLEIKQSHLEATTEGNIIMGICRIIQDALITATSITALPIAAFSHKHNTFYIYEENANWTIMNEDAVNRLFDTLSNRMLKTYNKWEDTQPDLILETEESQNKKNYYKSKMLGLSICDETKYRKFTNWLFNHLKKNIKGITEYEFD